MNGLWIAHTVLLHVTSRSSHSPLVINICSSSRGWITSGFIFWKIFNKEIAPFGKKSFNFCPQLYLVYCSLWDEYINALLLAQGWLQMVPASRKWDRSIGVVCRREGMAGFGRLLWVVIRNALELPLQRMELSKSQLRSKLHSLFCIRSFLTSLAAVSCETLLSSESFRLTQPQSQICKVCQWALLVCRVQDHIFLTQTHSFHLCTYYFLPWGTDTIIFIISADGKKSWDVQPDASHVRDSAQAGRSGHSKPQDTEPLLTPIFLVF